MAITGTGTQADPYIVHSYTELKDACAGVPSTSYLKFYVELANDIDCNEYGENFEWETIKGKSNGAYAYALDLKGHTIKNFKVKDNQWAFHLSNSYSGSCEIQNGKILNAYLSDSAGFATIGGNSLPNASALLKNLSISVNASRGLASSSQYMFKEILIDSCAIYVEGTMWSGNYNAVFRPYSESYPISNCDILVNFPQQTGSHSESLFYGVQSNQKSVRNCRIRGTFNTTYGAMVCGAHNCVVDLANPSEAHFSQTFQSCTGVINSDKWSGTLYSGLTPVTSAEIINGAALRAKGFDVLNVTS